MKFSKEAFLVGIVAGALTSGYCALNAERKHEAHEADIRAGNGFARAVQCSEAIYYLEGAGVSVPDWEKRDRGDTARRICLSSDEVRPEQN